MIPRSGLGRTCSVARVDLSFIWAGLFHPGIGPDSRRSKFWGKISLALFALVYRVAEKHDYNNRLATCGLVGRWSLQHCARTCGRSQAPALPDPSQGRLPLSDRLFEGVGQSCIMSRVGSHCLPLDLCRYVRQTTPWDCALPCPPTR